jgi:hypothetical protein
MLYDNIMVLYLTPSKRSQLFEEMVVLRPEFRNLGEGMNRNHQSRVVVHQVFESLLGFMPLADSFEMLFPPRVLVPYPVECLL